MRKQEEIIKKINDGFTDDYFDSAKMVLVYGLSFENAKKFLQSDISEKIEKENLWERYRFKTKKDLINELKNTISIASNIKQKVLIIKLINKCRGLLWLIDDELYKKFNDLYKNCYDYKKLLNFLNEIMTTEGYDEESS